jgi:hypothetical protein
MRKWAIKMKRLALDAEIKRYEQIISKGKEDTRYNERRYYDVLHCENLCNAIKPNLFRNEYDPSPTCQIAIYLCELNNCDDHCDFCLVQSAINEGAIYAEECHCSLGVDEDASLRGLQKVRSFYKKEVNNV